MRKQRSEQILWGDKWINGWEIETDAKILYESYE